MMAYTFDKSLETGNIAIDNQHRELIDAINNLLNACSQGKGRDEIKNTINFLTDYTVKHFIDEEKLQKQYNYPDYPAHKKLHDDFKEEVSKIVNEYEENGTSVVLTFKVNNIIASWLIKHIKGEDKKVAAYIKNAK